MPYKCEFTVYVTNPDTGQTGRMGAPTTRSGTTNKVRRLLTRAEKNGRINAAKTWIFTRTSSDGTEERYDPESGTWKVLIQ